MNASGLKVVDRLLGMTDKMESLKPTDYNEANRYLPSSVTSKPGYIRYYVNPFMREILDCADIDSPVREINVMKGVQITYTTLLESIILYYADYIGTLPMMYMTADKGLADARVENNIIVMLNQSDKADIIVSSDTDNPRKTGKTKNHLQFSKGGYLVPFGAQNADKMLSYSISILLKDEVDAWPETVGKRGDPDSLSDARIDSYSENCKIFRGSTPLWKATSKIYSNYLKGDQRKYMIPCRQCGEKQELRWNVNEDEPGGFKWDFSTDGILLKDTVRYCCQACEHPHFEYDKGWLFDPENGAEWIPTATPIEEGIRSYHLPALYSPMGMRPWWKCVLNYLEAYDPVEKKTKNFKKLQVFYNSILAKPFEHYGGKVRFAAVSAHRRTAYRLGEVPNKYAVRYSGSPILFLTCAVDVHKDNLAVSVFGWCRDAICYLVEYRRFETKSQDEDCTELSSPVWGKLRELIEEKEYKADDGHTYRVQWTLIDSGYANDTVVKFCKDYHFGVYPSLGRSRSSKNQTIKEFSEFTTQSGTTGYKVVVDHYKDRLAPVLRREWIEEEGKQREYHFNAPVDISDKSLKELTVEVKREETDTRGVISYAWYRPGNARNELWDLLVLGHASVELFAWVICVKHFELETIDWDNFWDYMERENNF